MGITQVRGNEGEDQAALFLQNHGYTIHFRNYRERFGEIDIIAEDHGVLVFVEVKYRTSSYFGTPLEAINRKKLQSIIITSQMFIQKKRPRCQGVRYDAI